MSVAPSSPQPRTALDDAGKRLTQEAAAYLATVDLFRAEGCDPMWRSDGAGISPLSLSAALDVTRTVSVTGEGLEA